MMKKIIAAFSFEMAKETDDRRELRNQTLQVFLVGYEATAIGVGNAIFWLCRNQKVWEKLRKEVLEHMERDEELTFESLKGMRYLQWVVNESRFSLRTSIPF